MKKIFLAAIIVVFTFAGKAQSNIEEIQLLQSMYGMDKKDLIAKHMKIEAAKTDVFWKLYDEYEIARKDIGMKRADNIVAYANKYENLTNADADALAKASLNVQSSYVKLWEKTYKKMAKEISPVTAAQFIQAEMFFENVLRNKLAMDIPLIGEFEMEK